MTPENFCYWLRGFFELTNTRVLSEYQIEEIKNHLNLVFKKEPKNTDFYSIEYPLKEVYNHDTPIC